MAEELDNIEEFEAKETARKLPKGWLILLWGLIIFGVIYTYLYTPNLGGWSQSKAYEESVKK
ncbi:MAG: cbb3-type cytochrome c oxidase N-terminal domain-containing protein [Thermodesulfovibrionales bacterium]|nr:cbb3-type cytochrome c oxidase N-terminal domain-containing protein [Thermodesulfovibrionales bacterium]